jgi:sarcosine oxidase gamma subunit
VFRTTHALKDGKTARQLLSEQLALLDAKMREVVLNVTGADAQALLANGRFLEMKFQQPDFLVR